MKKCFLVGMFSLLFIFQSVSAADLSIEQQQNLIQSYMFLTGQLPADKASAAADELGIELPHKCGMPVVREFMSYYDKFDKGLLKSSGVEIQDRPVLSDSLASPSGRFLIHYTTSGDSAAYTGYAGGAVGYIDSVARIMDDVYDYTVNVLGYPAPPVDSFYPEGGDEKYDVYISNIPGFYGLAYPDFIYETTGGDTLATAFLELDNDYAELNQYRTRPLDAVRVTAAHEFFHMVQFGLDYRESEDVSNAVNGPAWMEMSSVWMEEEQYDDINDYYNYLPFFFDDPRASIQQFKDFGDLHPYASGIFPIFLSEKYGRDIIKAIWLKCGEYGPGPDFLEVVGEVVDSASGGTESYETVFNEFAVWNYFTGDRAYRAPAGTGYSEKDDYDIEFSDNPFNGEIRVEYDYPFLVVGGENFAFNPDHNGAFYLSLIELQKVEPIQVCTDFMYDTTYWICNTGTFPGCTDSSEVTSADVYDTLYIDSTYLCIDSLPSMKFFFGLDPAFSNPWGLSVIYRFRQNLDSVLVDNYLVAAGSALGFDILNPNLYRSVTFVFTPASTNRNFYAPPADYYVASGVSNTINLDSVDAFLPAVAFYPYPNPAIVDKMTEETIKFKFQHPTDSTGFPINFGNTSPYLVINIFSISGERVQTLSKLSEALINPLEGEDILAWDMKNEAGKDVASGVYLAYARLYTDIKKSELLIDNKTKIAIIR